MASSSCTRKNFGKRRYLKEPSQAIPRQSLKKWIANEIFPYVQSVGVDGDYDGESGDTSHSDSEYTCIVTPELHGIRPVMNTPHDDAHSDISTTEEVPTSYEG